MVKINTVQDEITQILHAQVDAREEREEARDIATSDFHERQAWLEQQNWEWWQANRAA